MEIEKLSTKYCVRKLTVDEVDSIYALCSQNTVFYQFHPPFVTRESIVEDMEALPPGKTSRDKTAFLGLFMIKKKFQGKGIGTDIIEECVAYLFEIGFQKIRLAIDKGNPQSEAFWTKNLFLKTGEECIGSNSVYLPMERILEMR